MSWFQRSPPNPLRVACEKIVKGCKNVAYFPSYEIVTGGFGKTSYFAEDCRLVTEEGVAHVMRVFMRHHVRNSGTLRIQALGVDAQTELRGPMLTLHISGKFARSSASSSQHYAHDLHYLFDLTRLGRGPSGKSADQFFQIPHPELQGAKLIDIRLVAPRLFQRRDKSDRLVGRAGAVRRDDFDQRRFDILCHALGIAADIEMRASREPLPNLGADFAHPILDVEFSFAVARPGERETRKHAFLTELMQLVAIEEVAHRALMTEEEPVLPWRADRLPLLQKGAEGRDPGSGPNHDDRNIRIGR